MANYAHMWPIALSISQLCAQLFVHINDRTHGKRQPSFQIFLLGEADGVVATVEMFFVGTKRESETRKRKRVSDRSLQMALSAKESKNRGMTQGQHTFRKHASGGLSRAGHAQ